MSYFRPQRASPPPRPPTGISGRISEIARELHASDNIPLELTALSADDVGFIEGVINRLPPTSVTLITIFKAYSDELQARGLDPKNEVVYYGKLLKVGMVKAPTWKDKWNVVKDRIGHTPSASATSGGGRRTRITRSGSTPARTATKPPLPASHPPPELETCTLHSHQDENERQEIANEPLTKPPARRRVPGTITHDTPRPYSRFDPPAASPSVTNSLGLDTGPPSMILDSGDALRRIAVRARNAAVGRWEAETTTDTTTQVSSIPPPYRAAVRDASIPFKEKGKEREKGIPGLETVVVSRRLSPVPPVQPLSKPLSSVPPIERRGSMVEVEDPFEKIKRERDEREADHFRNDRLVERCYDVWKQGYLWILVSCPEV